MKTTSGTGVRSRLKKHLPEIENKETLHLLSTEANARRLMKGIKQAELVRAL